MVNTNRPKLGILIAFMLAAAIYRLAGASNLTPFAAYTPLGAMALFAGAYFGRGYIKYFLPMLIFFATELVINLGIHKGQYGVLHQGWYLTYGALILLVVLGHQLAGRITFMRVFGSAIAGSLLYWGIVDFGYWATGGLNITTQQPLAFTASGLATAYAQGLPFAKNFFIGTTAFSLMLFGAMEYAKQRFGRLVLAEATH